MKPPPFPKWAERFIILPSGKQIKFEPHQRLILDHCFTFDEEGKLPYSTIVFSCVKKSGKTTLNAVVKGYWAYNIEPPNEIITVANKRDQAIARAFKELKGFIQRDPILGGEVVSNTNNQIKLRNGSTILAIPNDFAGEAGSNHGLTTWDELWGFTTERDRRLYDELTPVPTRKNSIRFITTYAGFSGESELLENLYCQVFHEDGTIKGGIQKPLGDSLPCYAIGDMFMYWDHEPRMHWQTPEYYESQRMSLRMSTFLRLHKNMWVSSESGLFNMDRWDACTNPDHAPPLPDKDICLFVGVDASTKRDRSAVVSVYKDENGKIRLGPKRFWQPSKIDPMDLEETMEAYLLELSRGYILKQILYDPYQFHRSATTLAKKGLPMQEFPQTAGNLTEASQGLFDLVEFGNIVLYPCKDLRSEAAVAVAKETGRGLRIAKEKSTHKIDQIVALAMACLEATKSKASTFRYFFFDPEQYQSEETSEPHPS
jgi:phage terminase large subunit-like protein